ncbi:malonate transporter MadL subunit [Lewinella aquimaris]|uniref:Malonate transporter MadL subunit n=1 Tax=Neolewinella aquimaris TaxID=1835722 RepID=A0A840E7L7_9BACT|nr:malonate transporter subunit MadL [Neolewinella aquimaris]MBB4079615.1 malonate transporter MadL subunit [Neolewinella aquimaris]
MTIYGVALLAFCFLVGKITGTLLGAAIGIDGDVGGVGFAMILLVAGNTWLKHRGGLPPATAGGILFWSAMYIPIIVAMAAVQNVKAALSGGWLALLAGTAATVAGLLLVPVLSRIGRPDLPQPRADD